MTAQSIRCITRSTAQILVAALAVACNGDDAGHGEPPRHPGDGPLYMAATRVWDDTTTTSYFHLVSSLDADTEVDASEALEVPGAAKLFAYEPLGWFAIGGGEAPTITRYTLDDDGRLQKGESLSLQAYGVQDLWDSLYFVSEEKAYYPDTTGSQLIAWNPSTMKVTGAIELPETVRKGFLSYYGLVPLLRGERLIFSVGWFDWEENDTVLGETGLVVLDTETDEVERFDLDQRCGGITQVIETEGGDAYFVSSALAAATHRLGRLETEPCALRIRDGEDAFDASYLKKLGTLTEGALAGEPAPGVGDEILMRVFDEDLAEVEDGAQTWDLTGQSAWRWLRWDVASDSVEDVEALAPATADAFWFRVDGRVYASQTDSSYSETQLIELNADDGPRDAITLPGFLQGIARVR